MQWFDILIVVILLYATIRGAMKGIVWQLAIIAAIVLCFWFSESLSVSVAPYINVEPPLNRWLAMLGIYLGFSFICFAVARVLRDLIEKIKFQEYDRHLGALFGFIKGTIISLVLIFFIVTISQQSRATVLSSYSGRAAAIIMDRLHPVMPDELHEVLEPYIHSLDQKGLGLLHSDHHANIQHKMEQHGPDETPEPELTKTLQANTSDSEKLQRNLEEIVAIYFEAPEAQKTFSNEIQAILKRVPQGLALGVVEDWHADLKLSQPDPDPETNENTPLDRRILRQLILANLPTDLFRE